MSWIWECIDCPVAGSDVSGAFEDGVAKVCMYCGNPMKGRIREEGKE